MSPAGANPPIGCPVCSSQDCRWLKDTSKDAHVNYYRCNACGHVWWVEKGNTNQTTHDVTDRRPKKSS
jgi:uncharacterized Zn finger protein